MQDCYNEKPAKSSGESLLFAGFLVLILQYLLCTPGSPMSVKDKKTASPVLNGRRFKVFCNSIIT